MSKPGAHRERRFRRVADGAGKSAPPDTKPAPRRDQAVNARCSSPGRVCLVSVTHRVAGRVPAARVRAGDKAGLGGVREPVAAVANRRRHHHPEVLSGTADLTHLRALGTGNRNLFVIRFDLASRGATRRRPPAPSPTTKRCSPESCERMALPPMPEVRRHGCLQPTKGRCGRPTVTRRCDRGRGCGTRHSARRVARNSIPDQRFRKRGSGRAIGADCPTSQRSADHRSLRRLIPHFCEPCASEPLPVSLAVRSTGHPRDGTRARTRQARRSTRALRSP